MIWYDMMTKLNDTNVENNYNNRKEEFEFLISINLILILTVTQNI